MRDSLWSVPVSKAAKEGSTPSSRATGCSAAWLARLLWEQEVRGSNPRSPTLA